MNSKYNHVASKTSVPSAMQMGLVCVSADMQARVDLEAIASQVPGVQVASNVERPVSEREVMRLVEAYEHRICVIDFDDGAVEAGRYAQRLHDAHDGDLSIFAMSSEPDPEHIISAMRAGCSEYLLKPLATERVLNALAHVEARRQNRSSAQSNGKIVTLVGAKGGTGVTSIALYLALNLVQEHQQKCLLVDQHTALGDISLYLGLGRHQYSFYELVHNTDRLDLELLQGFLLQHSSGLDVLDSPEAIGALPHASADAIEQTLGFLAETYPFVLIDCPPGLSETTVSAVKQSDQLAIIITPEIPAIRNALRYIDHLCAMQYPEENIHIVLNRHAKRSALSDEQIEQALRRRISVKIPNNYGQMVAAINAGTPIDFDSKSVFSEAFAEWASLLAGKQPPPPASVKASRSLLGIFGL